MRYIIFGLVCWPIGSWAATIGPGDVVALSRDAVIAVNLDTEIQTVLPLPKLEAAVRPRGSQIAANGGSIFVLNAHTATDMIQLAVYNLATEQWSTVSVSAGLTAPYDMDVMPDGNLLASGEFGIIGVDPQTGNQVSFGPINYPPDINADQNTRSVEIDSSGAIITDVRLKSHPSAKSILRQRPGAETVDRYDPDFGFLDYALESDAQLVVLTGDELYQINLETAVSELLFQGIDLRSGKILVDSNEHVLVLESVWQEPSQLTRIEPTTGATELFAMGVEVWDFDIVPSAIMLQPGDADQDVDFDQFDLVQVQQAAKYLTGQPATWGEGDWNGAPGGSRGNPPPGDGVFDQFDLIAAQQGATYNTGPYASLQRNGQSGDAQTSIIYDANTGEISVDAPAGVELTSINIDSAAGIFAGDPAQNLGGSFDNDADGNIFKATFGSSFGSLSFGNVAPPGLSEEFVASDLTVVGSLAGGGDLGPADLIYVPVPEPSALVLGLLAALVAAGRICTRPRRDSPMW